MHAFRCARRCASALPKPSSGIHRIIPSTNSAAAGQSLHTTCRRPYASEPTNPDRGTPIRDLGTLGKIEEFYDLPDGKDMSPTDITRTEMISEKNREVVKDTKGAPPLRFTDIKTGIRYHAGRSLVTGEQAKELYAAFKPHVDIVQPGPTDLPGKPTQVHILYRDRTSPAERILESIRRLCFNPSYIVTKEFGPHTVKSTDLINVELGYNSHFLPYELKPMALVYKNWKISKGGKSLEKIFRFDNRESAREFANGLQRLIKIKINKTTLVEHHPAFGVYGRRVFVRWGTEQPEEGISSWDIACAKQTDRWAGACNVKDLLPEILEWKFETKFVDKSMLQQQATKSPDQRPSPPPDPVTDASDNLMNIIENLMATTKSLMQAAEDPSTVQGALAEAAESLSKTMEVIRKEKEENKVLEKAKEAEVLKWLDDGDESQVEAESEFHKVVERATEALGSDIVEDEVEVDAEAENVQPEATETETETAAAESVTTKVEVDVQSEATKTGTVESAAVEADAESPSKEAVADSETPKDEKAP